MTLTDSDLAGRVIASQFRIEKLLGEGGMGAVYLASQLEMNRQVVVKVAHQTLAKKPAFEERFRREAQVVAQLNHPNVVQVFVSGRTEEGQLFLAMEYVPGRTLSQQLERTGRLAEARALRIVDQICDALVEAHSLGLVHRDLKPDNVMLTERHGCEDYVKVLDFGIAKILGETDQKLTQTGAIFGTPKYMAPEQARSKPVDQRTDIYSLGLVLYEMVTGGSPFSAGGAMDYLFSHINVPPELPSQKFADVDLLPRTEAMIMKCLAKAPEDRFQSAAELQREARLCLRDRPVAARSFPTPATRSPAAQVPAISTVAAPDRPAQPSRPGAPGKRWRAPLVAVLALTALVAVLGLTVFGYRGDPTNGAALLAGDSPGNPVGDLMFGVPVPRGSELVQRTDQTLFFRAPIPGSEVLAFYRKYLGRAWGPVKDALNGLQFMRKDGPYAFVTVTRQGEYSQVILTPNALGKPMIRDEERTVLGLVVPAGAKSVMETKTNGTYTIAFVVHRSLRDAIEDYRKAFPKDPRYTVSTDDYNSAPSFSVTARVNDLPFKSIALTSPPENMLPGPGEWTMVTATK